MAQITALDTTILFGIQNLRTPFLDICFQSITYLGNFIWVLLALALLCTKKTRMVGITVLSALLLSVLIGDILLKPLIARARPCHVYTDLALLIPTPKSFSFPSGHTMTSFASATSVYLYNKKFGIPLLILAVAIGFSRLYLFVHYPTDIFGGCILGIVLGVVSKKLVLWSKIGAKL